MFPSKKSNAVNILNNLITVKKAKKYLHLKNKM